MSKRSITDTEIAIVKAMLQRKIKNKDIQFFFNRPDRPVNSGRITGIRDGSYGSSKDISPVSDQQLDAFIAGHSGGPSTYATLKPFAADTDHRDPLSDGVLADLFGQCDGERWRLTLGETDTHECKTSFSLKYPSAWLRAIAALANNAGGYVFFGVLDKGTFGDGGEDMSYVASGMKTDEFAKMDPVELTKRVKSVFDPTPRVSTRLLTLGTATVGVMHVERHESRPVISIKNEGNDVREGDIYFRYPGQSARIKYSDLRTLLDARDRDAREQILPMVERLLQLGPERSMIADLADGTLGDGKQSIQIDAALIDKLVFVKEGNFSEVAGAPTLRLMGEVQPTGHGETGKIKLGL